MIRVILESPYAGDIERNIKYARMCVKHSLSLGEAPIASHLLYTQEGILNDDIEHERMLGINAGLAWKEVAEKHVFYVDYGWSKGMKYAHDYATKNNIPIEIRAILPIPIDSFEKPVKKCGKKKCNEPVYEFGLCFKHYMIGEEI